MAGSSGRPNDFLLRALRTPEEFRHAEELQTEGDRGAGGGVVTAPVLRLLRDNGGIVVGALADIYLAGVIATTIGWDGTALFQEVVSAVVRPEYQNHRLGFRLATFLRQEVLALGLSEVRWAFDPLYRQGASLSVRRLGARPDAYLSNYFGQVSTGSGPTEESDRLRVRWTLGDAEVERRAGGQWPTTAEELERRERSSTVIVTETSESGLRLPSEVAEPEGASASLEIPFDLAAIRSHEPANLRRWRHAVRDAFRASLDLGYAVDGFATVTVEHERRCFYFLSPRKAAPDAGA